MWRTADRGGSQTEEARGGSQKINKEQAAPPHRWALPRLASGDHKLGGGGVVVTPQHALRRDDERGEHAYGHCAVLGVPSP